MVVSTNWFVVAEACVAAAAGVVFAALVLPLQRLRLLLLWL